MPSSIPLILLTFLKLYTTPIMAQASINTRTPTTISKQAAAQRRTTKSSSGILLAGTVYYDINANGSRDANEPTIPNVTVQIRDCSNALLGSTVTNSIGEFIMSMPAGCYYARFDMSKYTFSEGTDVNSLTGRTESVTLKEGNAKFWYVGVVPLDGITASPTFEPTFRTEMPSASPTEEATTYPPSESMIPSHYPTDGPEPTMRPTYMQAPSESPTISMHETAPSQNPTQIALPPLPGDDAGVVGEAIETRFDLSIFLLQDIRDATIMSGVVEKVFRDTVMDFLNEEWIFEYCVWGVALDVESQELSLWKGVRHAKRRHLRGGMQHQTQTPFTSTFTSRRYLRTEITVLQVKMLLKGIAYDDERVCPSGAIPPTNTTYGDGWEETMALIGVDYTSDNCNRLGDRLKSAHEYFDPIFAVAADSELLQKTGAETATTIVPTTTTTETKTAPLILIIVLIIAAVSLSLLLCLLWSRRRRKHRREMQEEARVGEGPTIETPKDIMSAEQDESQGNKPMRTVVENQASGEEITDDGIALLKEDLGLIDNAWPVLKQEEATVGEAPTIETPKDIMSAEQDESQGNKLMRLMVDNQASEEEITDNGIAPLKEDLDPIYNAWPVLHIVPVLEEVIMMRGLPRRRSEPNMATKTSMPIGLKRTRSIGSIREVWINLNKPWSYKNPRLHEGYAEHLLNGTLYPIDDPDLINWEREKHLIGEDPSAPYVPNGSGAIEHNFIDEDEIYRIESPREDEADRKTLNFSETSEGEEPFQAPKAPKAKSLVMQQVEMLEAKWKQLREDCGEEGEYSDDEVDLDNVNGHIEQLMCNIEELELERKMKLNNRQEQEEEELAKKRMVRAGTGINYEQELNKDFVIRKKKKYKKVIDDIDLEDLSSESSEEEAGGEGEFDFKWMRLKVPLSAQDPSIMRTMVNKGKELDE